MWKDIKDFEGYYQISDSGIVRSIDRITPNKANLTGIQHLKGRVLKAVVQKNGYHTVWLLKNAKRKRFYVHHLVISHFLSEKPFEKAVVNHKDGDKSNNHISNLEWVSYSENNQHAYNNSLKPRGENFYAAKLTESSVRDILRTYNEGDNYNEIAKKYGVSRASIRDILKRKTWKHIQI